MIRMFPISFVAKYAALVAGLMGLSSANAQTQERERREAGPSVAAMLLVPAGPTTELYSIAAEKTQGPVQVGSTRVSDPLFPGVRAFQLAIADSSTPSGFRAVASVALPQTGRDFVALLQPQGDRYNVMLIDKNNPGFRLDAIAFYNATDVPVGVSVGGKRALLNPRKLNIVQPPSMGEKPFFQVQIYEIHEGKQKIIANTRWPHRTRSRAYIFLYRNEKTGRLTWQAVDEIINKS